MNRVVLILSYMCITLANAKPYSQPFINNTTIKPHRRYLADIVKDKTMPCVVPNNNSCTCKYNCFQANTKNNLCVLKKCKAWDSIAETCTCGGAPKTLAIVFQAIPATGPIGVGWAIIGRNDWGMSIWITMGVITVLACGGICSSDENGEGFMFPLATILGGLFSLYSFVLWIYGIVVMANDDILDGDGCHLC